jgi:hypothetical protein
MRGRHFPRLCRCCDAPMARQQDACWSCATAWNDDTATPHAQRVIHNGDAVRPGGADQPPAPVVIGEPRAIAQARRDLDRWADEGGSEADEGSRRPISERIAAVQ